MWSKKPKSYLELLKTMRRAFHQQKRAKSMEQELSTMPMTDNCSKATNETAVAATKLEAAAASLMVKDHHVEVSSGDIGDSDVHGWTMLIGIHTWQSLMEDPAPGIETVPRLYWVELAP